MKIIAHAVMVDISRGVGRVGSRSVVDIAVVAIAIAGVVVIVVVVDFID